MNKIKQLMLVGTLLCPLLAQATFISDLNGNLFQYEENTNTSTLIGNSGVAMFDIARDPTTGLLYGYDSSTELYLIDQTDASITLIGASSNFVNGLTFSSDGTLFGSGDSSLYTVDLLSGESTLVGSGGYSSSGDIAFDNIGNLYLSSVETSTDSLWTIDITTGIGTLLGDTGFEAVYGLNFTGGTLFGYTLNGETISLDTVTGAGTLISANNIGASGADGEGGVTRVNAPVSLLFLGMGLLGLASARKRKQL